MSTGLEHARLVALGAAWLRRQGFPIVATELRCFGSREQPDVLGFRSHCSTLIEVKTSRGDFLADRKKPERAARGLGLYRFYLCPEGLLQVADLPPGWGLLVAIGSRVTEIVRPRGNLWPPAGQAAGTEWEAFQHQPDMAAERQALFSIARRASATPRGRR
ncbi:hypothetical protein [uncultured Pseudomonas sp.]|uniref:hypothetical protein n=1 Tax=uncultured Pseudomonas sp. TaxID=114707 RepID=UPI00258E4020|nr:hypothetical protein [uncultured Pseudomonas sp.]